MRAFFSAEVGYIDAHGTWKPATISGILDFDYTDWDGVNEIIIEKFKGDCPNLKEVTSVTIKAFTPLEFDSSNHTQKLIELWRIERNEGEYYGGMNTNAYVNKELQKLGIVL